MTPSEFRAAFPAFENAPEPKIQRVLDRATPYFDVARWDDLYSDGLGNWVAHWLECEAQDVARGPGNAGAGDVTSKRVGDVSVTRDASLLSAQASDPYQRTTYGQRYRYLATLVGRGGIAV